MKNQTLSPGVVQQPIDSLNRGEVYWVEQGKRIDRILAVGEAVEDGEISWTQARIQEFRKVHRTLLQKLMKTEIDSIDHPSGFEVVQADSAKRTGHLFTVRQDGIDLQKEVGRRMPMSGAKILRISDLKIVVEGEGVPVAANVIDQSVTLDALNDTPQPVEKMKGIYKGVLSSLGDIIAKNHKNLSAEDTKILYELDNFRKDRVKWATLTPESQMMADEPGKIGDAWIFVVPPGHSMMKTQQSTHAMNYDNAGLNPYLSILPHDMTHRWAGLGAVHELSHLRDAVLGIEPSRGRTRDQYLEGEHRAYSVERALAFAYSEGRLQQALESIVREALNKGDAMSAINSLVNERLPAISQSLNLCVEPQAARSKGELGVRQGLYAMLIGFEIARQVTGGEPVSTKSMEKGFIELMYEPTGHLPKA